VSRQSYGDLGRYVDGKTHLVDLDNDFRTLGSWDRFVAALRHHLRNTDLTVHYERDDERWVWIFLAPPDREDMFVFDRNDRERYRAVAKR
jgi:hypothetical protein